MPVNPQIALQGTTAPLTSPVQTLGQLAQLQSQRQEQQLNAYKLGELAHAQGEQIATDQAFSQASGDPKAALALLYKNNHPTAALAVQAKMDADDKARAEAAKIYYENYNSAMTQGSQLLQGIQAPEDENDTTGKQRAQNAYAAILPSLRQVVAKANPDLATKIPEAYDPEWVKNAVTWGQKASDFSEGMKRAADIAHLTSETAKNDLERYAGYTKSLATGIASLDPSDPQFASHLKVLEDGYSQQNGFNPTIFSQFTAMKPAEVVAQAQRVLGGKPPEVGTFGDYLTRYAADHKTPVSSLSAATVSSLRQQFGDAERGSNEVGTLREFITRRAKEDGVDVGSMTGTQEGKYIQEFHAAPVSADNKAAAERWLQNSLSSITKDRNKLISDAALAGGKPDQASMDALAKRESDVNASFKRQVGGLEAVPNDQPSAQVSPPGNFVMMRPGQVSSQPPGAVTGPSPAPPLVAHPSPVVPAPPVGGPIRAGAGGGPGPTGVNAAPPPAPVSAPTWDPASLAGKTPAEFSAAVIDHVRQTLIAAGQPATPANIQAVLDRPENQKALGITIKK